MCISQSYADHKRMTPGTINFSGQWWKFDRYEVKGPYIRPAPGATLSEYDPWAEYVGLRAKRAYSGDGPYEELANIGRFLRQPGKTGAEAQGQQAEFERLVLGWCNRFGLPGTLLHHAQSVRLAPWSEGSFRPRESQMEYAWRGGEWVSHEEGRPPEGASFPPLPPAGVQIRQMHSLLGLWDYILSKLWRFTREPLAATWHLFFPVVSKEEAETFQYPRPLSEKFWDLYAEPVQVFTRVAVKAYDILVSLQEIQGLPLPPKEPRKILEYAGRLKGFESDLNQFLEGTGEVAQFGPDGRFHPASVASSLIGVYGRMILEDSHQGARIVTCDHCGKLFVTDAYQARFCSPRCRMVIQKREYRAKAKEERAFRSARKKGRKKGL